MERREGNGRKDDKTPIKTTLTNKTRRNNCTDRTKIKTAGFLETCKPKTVQANHYTHPKEFITTEPEEEEESDGTDELAYVNMKIGQVNLKGLIDTGSQLSLINKSIVDDNPETFDKNIVKIKKIKLVGANHRKLAEVDKLANVNVRIGDESYAIGFVIVAHLTMDAIIGKKFLSGAKALIDLEREEVRINENIIQFVSNDIGQHETQEVNMTRKNNSETMQEKSPMASIQCPPIYEQEVRSVLRKHEDLVNYVPRIAQTYVHKLQVEDEKPFICKRYPIPHKYKEKVQQELRKMEDDQIIEKARTEYISPLVIVEKKDESIRLCLDARKINEITKKQYDSPQNIDVLITKIKKDSIFSKLDLKNSFWLIPLHQDSRKYTGFSVDGQVYQFKTVPFGLQSSTAALTCALRPILEKYDDFYIHYVDNILGNSEDPEKQKRKLQRIPKAADKAGPKLKIQNWQSFQDKQLRNSDKTLINYKTRKRKRHENISGKSYIYTRQTQRTFNKFK